MSSKPKKNRTKQYLMLLTVAGLIAIVGGSSSGTFASFTAETTNTGNYFADRNAACCTTTVGTTTCTSEAALEQREQRVDERLRHSFRSEADLDERRNSPTSPSRTLAA